MYSPKIIADKIIRNFDYESEPKSLLKMIVSLLISQGESEIQAYEYASDVVFVVRDEISKELEKNRKSAILSNCELVGDDYCTVIGTSCERPTDTKEIIDFRKSALFFNEILDFLCALHPKDFELFCKKLLCHMGASKAIVTKHSSDEGIDFLARISLPDSFRDIRVGSFEEEFAFLVFGQAKRYLKDTKVGTPEIRELVGSSIILRYKELMDSKGTSLNSEFANIRLCDPMQCLFLTTGQFSSPAQQLAEKTGVVLKDGSQIATYITFHRIGFENKKKLLFNKDDFIKWIRS